MKQTVMTQMEPALKYLARVRSRDHVPRFALAGLILCALLAGCTETRPGGYGCVTKGGCWTVLQLTHAHTDTAAVPDLDGPRIAGVASDIQVVPLSCDAGCRGSSGDSTKPGFIATEVCLYETDNGAWACVGYRTGSAGQEQYFIWYAVPGKTTTIVPLGDVTPAKDSSGVYPYATFGISSSMDITAGCGLVCLSSGWGVYISPPGGASISHTLPFDLGAFQPTHIQYTQYIYGTSGATAGLALFTVNYYSVTMHGTAPDLSPTWQPFAHDGILGATGTATSPGYAAWARSPTKSASGGLYYVYCCTATLI